MNTHPTEPGPFQKYLFASACYVSLGECYHNLVALQEKHASSQELVKLQARLMAICQQTIEHNQALAGTLFDHPELKEQLGWDQVDLARHEQVLALGRESMQQLIEMFLASPQSYPDFQSFFQAWAEACDSLWQRLAYTETVAEIIGQVANSYIVLTTSGTPK